MSNWSPQIPGNTGTSGNAGTPGNTGAMPIARWCAECSVPGLYPELSDDAAILIASGRVDAQTREVVVRRIEADRIFPELGGYARLRRMDIELAALRRHKPASKPVAAAVGLRATELSRRIGSARTTFVTDRQSFSSGFRGVRKDRREDVHLDVEQREALFKALRKTPTANLRREGWLGRATAVATDRIGPGVIRMIGVGMGSPTFEDKANVVIDRFRVAAQRTRPGGGPQGPSATFEDRFETLLFLTGTLYQRIVTSHSWSTEHFDAYRGQLHLVAEIASIAADASDLARIHTTLEAQGLAGTRDKELDPIWAELVQRVVEIGRVATVIDAADAHLAAMRRQGTVTTVDAQIEELVRRAGEREVFTENTRSVVGQLEIAAEVLGGGGLGTGLPGLPPPFGDSDVGNYDGRADGNPKR